MSKKLIDIKDLTIRSKEKVIISDISFSINQNEIIGFVGESGSGKSTILNVIDGLLSEELKIRSGEIIYNKEIFGSDNILDIRGNGISYIFQDPTSYLNPLMRVGKQIEEGIKDKVDKKELKNIALNLLKKVGFKNCDEIYKRYPHELSGGQCQKIMIASVIASHPKLILADEPTSSLDLNVRDDILSLLKSINEREKTSVIIVSHDIQSLVNYVDKLYVLNKGNIVETGKTMNIIKYPKRKYTQKLINSTISLSSNGGKNG